MTNLWHGFLALHPVAYVVPSLLLALIWLRHKAITAAVKMAREVATTCVRNAARRWLGIEARGNERTYKGTFRDFGHTRPDEWFVTLANKDVETKIRVHEARLLFAVQLGSFVEVDTEVVPGRNYEAVRRVRVRE